MPFHPDAALRNAFQGYQGPNPANCRVIFVGKDANFPDWNEIPLPHLQQLQRDSTLAFLENANGNWRWNHGEFRESPLYVSRNQHQNRAHHPFLLSCFPGHRDGAPYHRTMARLIDMIINSLQFAGQNALADNLVTTHSTFVELIRLPTTGNNGNVVPALFQGHMPQGWGDDVGFGVAQEIHRCTTLPNWLLNSNRQKLGQQTCVVVLPKSVFQVLCGAEWHELNNEHLQGVSNWFLDNPNQCVCHLPGFQDRHWLIVDGFPYFPHFAGWNGVQANWVLNQMANQLANALQQ
jgi:hypothetical protein